MRSYGTLITKVSRVERGWDEPVKASLWVRYSMGEHLWAPLLTWGGENGSYVENPDGLSDFFSFEDRYRDCWPSFSDYLVEEIELIQESWPEEAICYFDEDAYEYARLDYTVLDAPQGEVYVFKDL